MWIRRSTVDKLVTDLNALADVLDRDADENALAGSFDLAEAQRSAATAYVHAGELVRRRLSPVPLRSRP